MANPDYRVPSSVAGAYYVDDSCIDCDLCRSTAPLNFARSEDAFVSFVSRQPANDEEKRRCDKALAECPVEAIGDDGAETTETA